MQKDKWKILGKRREGKEGEILTPNKLLLKIYVRFVKCRDQMRDSVTTSSSMKDKVSGKMCNERKRTKLRTTGDNLKIQTARCM